MSFLLDTDTCSAALKQDPRVFNRFVQYGGRLYTSRIVLAELYAWAFRASNPLNRLDAIERLQGEVALIEFTDDCARWYGRLRLQLLALGQSVPSIDLLIAASALAFDHTLVTHNTKDFMPVPGLRVVDWLVS